MKLLSGVVSLSACLTFAPSFAQDRNPWGETFTCSVNWFARCAIETPDQGAESTRQREKPTASNSLFPQQRSSLPEPVRNFLETPSLETAKAYVAWSREAQEKLSRATAYIAQATRDMRANEPIRSAVEQAISIPGLGPAGLYYFFSPSDRTAASDVAVLNKIFQEGKLGVVGIPVLGGDDEIASFNSQTKPLFPLRRSEAEVRLVKPVQTPELYLALPLQKTIVRLRPLIDETSIGQEITSVVAARTKQAASLQREQ